MASRCPPSNSPCKFTDYPTEIRIKFYDIILGGQVLKIVSKKPTRPARKLKKLAIFLANKQIYSEASHYFYSKNTFVLGPSGNEFTYSKDFAFRLVEISRFVSCVDPRNLAIIEKVCLKFNIRPLLWATGEEDFWELTAPVINSKFKKKWQALSWLGLMDDTEHLVNTIETWKVMLKNMTGLRHVFMHAICINKPKLENFDSASSLCKFLDVLSKVEKLEAIYFEENIAQRLKPTLSRICTLDKTNTSVIRTIGCTKDTPGDGATTPPGADSANEFWWLSNGLDNQLITVKSLET